MRNSTKYPSIKRLMMSGPSLVTNILSKMYFFFQPVKNNIKTKKFQCMQVAI